jgi:hypothetical protein
MGSARRGGSDRWQGLGLLASENRIRRLAERLQDGGLADENVGRLVRATTPKSLATLTGLNGKESILKEGCGSGVLTCYRHGDGRARGPVPRGCRESRKATGRSIGPSA